MWSETGPNLKGKVRYRISDEQRRSLLSQMEKLFGDDIRKHRRDAAAKTGSYSAIGMMMTNFYDTLSIETYEEAQQQVK